MKYKKCQGKYLERSVLSGAPLGRAIVLRRGNCPPDTGFEDIWIVPPARVLSRTRSRLQARASYQSFVRVALCHARKCGPRRGHMNGLAPFGQLGFAARGF
jgi:hypothetical protein